MTVAAVGSTTGRSSSSLRSIWETSTWNASSPHYRKKQRAHFARVLVQLACGEAAHGPGLLLLDEPTANIDLRHQLDVMAAASARAARGVTVVAILHEVNLAALLAKRIVVLDHGRIDSDGEPGRVITDAMLERVLGVANAVGRTPAEGTPFAPSARRAQAVARQVLRSTRGCAPGLATICTSRV